MSSEAIGTTALRDDLETALGEFAEDVTVQRDRRIFVTLAEDDGLVPAMEILHDEGITHLSTITGLDDGEQYELLYHMLRYGDYEDGDLGEATAVTVRLFLDRDAPSIDSLVDVVPGAAMYEREVMDMLDVEFEGHPNPKRILLSDDWEAGPPLRKPDPVPEADDEAEADGEESTDDESTETEGGETAEEAEEKAAETAEETEDTGAETDEAEQTDDIDDTDDTDDIDDTDDTDDTDTEVNDQS